MKILLLAAALALAVAVFVRTSLHSQTAPVNATDRGSIPNEYFTAGSLNGYWWTHATEKERQIYLLAYGDGARESISVSADIYNDGFNLKMRVKDVFEKIFGRQIERRREYKVAGTLGAPPVAAVF